MTSPMKNKNKRRISLKGNGRVERKYERQSYKVKFKLRILNYWNECKNVESTVNKFWPASKFGDDQESKRKLFYQWKEQTSKLIEKEKLSNLQLCKIRPSGISCTLPLELEQYLASWIRSLRTEGIPVSKMMVSLQAKIIAEEFGITSEKFKASASFRFSTRTKTNQGQIASINYLDLALRFEKQVKEKVSELEKSFKVIWNADQALVQ